MKSSNLLYTCIDIDIYFGNPSMRRKNCNSTDVTIIIDIYMIYVHAMHVLLLEINIM